MKLITFFVEWYKYGLTGQQRNWIKRKLCRKHVWKNGICEKCNTKMGY